MPREIIVLKICSGALQYLEVRNRKMMLKKMSVHRSQQTTRDFAVPKIRAGNVSKNRESAISRSAGQP